VAKAKADQFVCNNCGDNFSKWMGRCTSCGEWNSLVVFRESKAQAAGKSGHQLEISELSVAASEGALQRLDVGIEQVNAVLGGGVVPGSLTLIAGEPGIGKSTLLLQMAASLSSRGKVLYVSGEESLQQIGLRARRLQISALFELSSSVLADDIAATIATNTYDVVIVDSIQTMSVEGVATSAGSASQVTNATQLIMQAAKGVKTAVIIVGHVTKEGSIAGPKLLEHMVDVVLSLEGDRYGGLKLLRTAKNRFGSTNEIGIFDMTDVGMVAVDNPSALLLAERQVSDGSVVLATIEGSRALLVEVQALVSKTNFGYPKRTASGIDLNRLNLLVAVLSQRTKLDLSTSDIYVNIVGGLRITEPAADLAVCMAIASAAKGMQLQDDAVVFGEVGLSGEVRHVPMLEKRLAEAKKLKFGYAIGPKVKGVTDPYLRQVGSVRDTLNQFLEGKR
jgi:DNA repair protein RadA/Sms